MEIIQDVGSYAGFAAVVGLAVLSALYFSQARDVRRLREWAGRAPERSAEQAAALAARPEQTGQQPGRPAPTGAVRPIPAAKPAAPGAQPGTATGGGGDETSGQPAPPKPAGAPGAAPPVPATAAAGANQGAKGAPVAQPAAQAAGAKAEAKAPGAAPQGSAPAPATPAAAPDQKLPTAAPSGTAKPAAPSPPLPARPASGPPVRRPPPRPGPVGRSAAAARSQSTAVLPASERLRGARGPADRPRRRLEGRYVALIAAGVIVLGGATAFGVSQLGGEDAPEQAERASEAEPQAQVNPSTVTVSVLNGTTVPGLAAQIGDEVESAGFQRGNVANALDQQRTTSAVLYAEGADREARLVARRLDISQVEPVDPDSQALAGNASVVVIVGADQTQ